MTSVMVAINPFQGPTPSPSEESNNIGNSIDKNLKNSAFMSGLIIACVIGALVICGTYYYFCYRERVDVMQLSNTLDDVSEVDEHDLVIDNMSAVI